MSDLDRSELIEALSWAEDMTRGRWGVEYATEVLEAHEAQVRRDVAKKCTWIALAPSRDALWDAATARMIALRIAREIGEAK